jgi:ferrous iron transport protein B
MSAILNKEKLNKEKLNSQKLNVALVGFPNSGKTTLYNWLTGSKYRTVNYPGSTVEYSVGSLIHHFQDKVKNEVHFIDTPGIYSFKPQSLDEEITVKLLKNTSHHDIHFVLLVIDGTQLDRQIHLVKSLVDQKIPFKIVLTMQDLLEKNKSTYDLKFLTHLFNTDVLAFDGILGKGLVEIIQACEVSNLEKIQFIETNHESVDNQWMSQTREKLRAAQNSKGPSELILKTTLKIDHYLMHPVWGYVFFLAVMTLLFSSIFWLAAPFMDAIDGGFSALVEISKEHIPGLIGEFVSEGVIAAIGGVIIFVPQIFILFVLIYFLEGSGYLARVAALIDKPMSTIGLGGRSFVPMLSGFGCAIPAIIATRNITSKKEKLLAQTLIPFLTCSARIPVFSLMIQLLLPDDNYLLSGLAMAALYFVSIVIAAIASGILSKLIKTEQTNKLLMDLPLYRRPRLKVTLLQGFERSVSFVKRAGPIIFVLSIIIWFATNFPRHEMGPDPLTASQIAQQSYAAQIGKIIEPVFVPMGFDWRVGFGIISAFAAREVFVSSLVLIFNAEGEDDQQIQSLLVKMKEAHWPDGTPLFTLGSSIGLLLFFMVAMQCLATFAILRKETGSYKIATLQLVGSNFLAYILAVGAHYFFLLW